MQSEAVSKKWYSEGCSKTGTTIKSAHHEGVAQAEQYWIFGMSVSQKKSIHNSSLVLVEHSFFNEFYRSGIAVLQATPSGESLRTQTIFSSAVSAALLSKLTEAVSAVSAVSVQQETTGRPI